MKVLHSKFWIFARFGKKFNSCKENLNKQKQKKKNVFCAVTDFLNVNIFLYIQT